MHFVQSWDSHMVCDVLDMSVVTVPLRKHDESTAAKSGPDIEDIAHGVLFHGQRTTWVTEKGEPTWRPSSMRCTIRRCASQHW